MIAIDETALARQVGTCLRNARRARKWTQARAARAIGVSEHFYGRIERGTGLPGLETLRDLLLVFERSPSAVFGGTPTPTASMAEDVPALRRIARRLRRASPRTIALVGEFLDEMDTLRRG